MSTISSTALAARIGAALLATTCAFGIQAAQAAPLRHHHARLVIPHSDFNAYAGPVGAPAQFEPSPVVGSWRYGLLRHGCGHSYPMDESGGCGTATGGPSGGIN